MARHTYTLQLRVRTIRFEGGYTPGWTLTLHEPLSEPAPSRSLLGRLWRLFLTRPEPRQPLLLAAPLQPAENRAEKVTNVMKGANSKVRLFHHS